MNRRELIRAVAAHTADDVKHVESLLSGVTDVITAVVSKGEAVTIQGFAKFAKVERAARMGRNPRTGEQIRIKASKRVRVSPMKAFKDTVMSPSQAPRLASGVYPTSPDLLAKQAAERRAGDARRAGNAATTRTGTRTVGTKKSAAKKAAAKRSGAKKTAATRAPAKKTLKKASAKRTTSTRAVAKRAPAKRSAGTGRTTAKKATAKRTAKRAGTRR